MSDIMTCMPFGQLLNWIRTEHDAKGTVFGVHRPYVAAEGKNLSIFGRNLETPIGPAAGPNSQLAQNIAAAYYAGSRFFELKTVQIMDGAELAACVNKPCIKADDECYNYGTFQSVAFSEVPHADQSDLIGYRSFDPCSNTLFLLL